MSDATVLAKHIVLQDLVQGQADPNLAEPIDGFLGADHHNVAAPEYRIGTKIKYYSPTLKGYGTMAYLQNGTAPDEAVAAGSIMIPAGASQNASFLPYKYTNDPDDGVLGGPCAIALSVMTDDYYGWFWCEGVAPVGVANAGIGASTTLDTDDSVVVAAISTINLVADQAGIGVAVTLKNDCGYSLKADS